VVRIVLKESRLLVLPRTDNSGTQHRSAQVKVEVTLRLTVSQLVSLGVEPYLGLMTRYLVLFDSYGLVFFLWGALSDEIDQSRAEQ
jgi:hypothetical protein